MNLIHAPRVVSGNSGASRMHVEDIYGDGVNRHDCGLWDDVDWGGCSERHDVTAHRKWMTISCTLVGIWLMAYVTKQLIFGRDHFGGAVEDYWSLYVPLLVVHTGLAIATISLGGTNMMIGLRRLRHGIGAGAMVAGVSRHRQLGHIMQWTFGGTLLTAYGVYVMLFYWYPV